VFRHLITAIQPAQVVEAQRQGSVDQPSDLQPIAFEGGLLEFPVFGTRRGVAIDPEFVGGRDVAGKVVLVRAQSRKRALHRIDKHSQRVLY